MNAGLTTATGEVVVQLLLVTPQMAQRWLENNISNRTIRMANVSRLALEIMEGRWICDPSLPPVAFDTSGRLLNGQHRLHAVVRSGVAVQMYVATNVSPSVMSVMDQGVSRQAGDVFKIKHGLTNPKDVAAAVTAWYRWKHFPDLVWQSHMIPSAQVLVDIYEQDVDDWSEAVMLGNRLHKPTRMIKAAVAAVAFRVNTTSKSDPSVWFDFVNGLATGENLRKGDPRLALRSWALNVTSKWGGNQWAVVGLTAGWNAYVDGRSLLQIKSRIDMLPMKDPA